MRLSRGIVPCLSESWNRLSLLILNRLLFFFFFFFFILSFVLSGRKKQNKKKNERERKQFCNCSDPCTGSNMFRCGIRYDYVGCSFNSVAINWWIILKGSPFLVGPNLPRKLGSIGLSDTYDLINIELSNLFAYSLYMSKRFFFWSLSFLSIVTLSSEKKSMPWRGNIIKNMLSKLVNNFKSPLLFTSKPINSNNELSNWYCNTIGLAKSSL